MAERLFVLRHFFETYDDYPEYKNLGDAISTAQRDSDRHTIPMLVMSLVQEILPHPGPPLLSAEKEQQEEVDSDD
jgi:hypothetical protein